MGGVKDAAVANDGAEAFAGIDGGTGGDELAVLREVNHVHVRAEDVGLGHGEAAAGVVVADAGDNLAGLMVIHIALAAEGIGKNVALADSDDVERGGHRVGFPRKLAVLGVEAPHETVVGAFLGAIESADVNTAVARTERTLGGYVIIRSGPDDLAGLWLEARSEAVVLNWQTSSRLLAGGVAEEDGVKKFAVENADAAVVAALAVF